MYQKGQQGLGTGLVFGIHSQGQGNLGVWLGPLILPLYFQGRQCLVCKVTTWEESGHQSGCLRPRQAASRGRRSVQSIKKPPQPISSAAVRKNYFMERSGTWW